MAANGGSKQSRDASRDAGMRGAFLGHPCGPGYNSRMALMIGMNLGPYQIQSLLGAGGMGEVYRARDSRLNRDVAIKVLLDEGAASTERRTRFEREARVIAALNHPNIVAVYDFGVEGGQQYIVSELVEGESLRSLLTNKPLPTRKLVDLATQVADGLAAAHAAGVVHRDLKPENIMLAKDGRVKILDFGLARQNPVKGSEETLFAEAVTRDHLTVEGSVVGTAGYMSPEQVLGKEAGYPSDQFSFGLILYEMASGKQAFARPSSIETMAAIVREEPPAIEEKLPTSLRWIINRCLSKEPEQRYESTRDLYQDLRNLRDHFSEAFSSEILAPVAAQAKRRRWRTPAVYAGFVLLAGLLGYLLRPTGQDIGNYRYTPFATDTYGGVWSPDGKAVAYASKQGDVNQVFLRYLDSPVPVQLTHEKQGVWPLGWSSDKNHLIVGQLTDRQESPVYKLYSVATVGGELEFILDFDCFGCGLSPDGKVFATLMLTGDSGYNVAVSDPVGSPLQTYTPAPFAGKVLYNTPRLSFSPDGKKILLYRAGDNSHDEAWLLPYPAGGKPPHRVLQKLPTFGGTPNFSWMPDSRYVVVSMAAEQDSPSHLWMADTESDFLTPLTTGTEMERNPMVAPDGKSVLYSQRTDHLDVVSVSVEDVAAKTLISTGGQDSMAAWSANVAKMVWVTNRTGRSEIWIHLPDGSERPVVTAADFPAGTLKWFMNPSLSPDGNRVIYVRTDNVGGNRLWMSSLSGGAPVRLTNAEATEEFGGSWSPDGSRFAYLQTAGGKTSLTLVRATGNATPVALTAGGVDGDLPDWSPDGNWITYRDDAGWHLISPDAKASKTLGRFDTEYLAFSTDGKRLYGIEKSAGRPDQDRATLFSLDPALLKKTVVKELGSDLQPASNFGVSIRFSFAPDGKSFVYSTEKKRDDLWLLRGYRQPTWLDRFRSLMSR